MHCFVPLGDREDDLGIAYSLMLLSPRRAISNCNRPRNLTYKSDTSPMARRSRCDSTERGLAIKPLSGSQGVLPLRNEKGRGVKSRVAKLRAEPSEVNVLLLPSPLCSIFILRLLYCATKNPSASSGKKTFFYWEPRLGLPESPKCQNGCDPDCAGLVLLSPHPPR
eukprot:Gregarina_sp_Poly_1__9983@NODE_662_length_6895_cov_76_689514_g492_i1_p5_GENE_NODE_662_length_6895_cov_76_689514_g492_i1NODE_662_length_6895_cov_76_689514_g492_i1_p5_ORF_typecomplete_len166_score14_60AGP/PF06376_12/0_28_NODE_662_length_6895_cov_76_689514_g492_i112321729